MEDEKEPNPFQNTGAKPSKKNGTGGFPSFLERIHVQIRPHGDPAQPPAGRTRRYGDRPAQTDLQPNHHLTSDVWPQSFRSNPMKREMSDRTQIIMRKLCCLFLASLPAMLPANPVSPTSPASAPAANAVSPVNAPAANAVVPTVPNYTEEQLLTEIGWLMSNRFQLSELGFNQDQIVAILRGVTLSLEGKDTPLPLESVGPKVSAYMQKRMQVARANAQMAAQAKEAAYFANLKSRGISSTPSGLYYEIIQQGTDKKPTANDSITVNYTGRLPNGKVFDSSAAHGKPAVLQMNRMIRGWAEGIQLIGVGGKIKLYVPFSLAYGSTGQRNIPPFSTLEFEVELLGINPAPVNPPPGSHPSVNRAPVSATPVSPVPVSTTPVSGAQK
jgi:FKBP-type peptidyl-prolyl cis-trans isomerase